MITTVSPKWMRGLIVRGGPTIVNRWQGLINGGGYDTGWGYCFEYNAKNSYGGYVGVKQGSVLLRGNGGTYTTPTLVYMGDGC
jgi:hypothetical protein